MSDSSQERSGEMLFTLMSVVIDIISKDKSVTDEQAEELAIAVCEEMIDRYSGLQFYFPKGRSFMSIIMHSRIFQQFNGTNVNELAKQHNVSVQHIYRVVKSQYEAKRNENSLPQIDMLGFDPDVN
ncbi:MAG: hypothetical protein COB35_04860 [Gammaproteobacteria bacterium]|nr:MAG: hypothetical protein COB35_04860 [Gammaproteobacteria bacterium]